MNEKTTDGADGAVVIIKRKKGGAHDDHHGGAWKIAYADFVTAMMAFFLLMWLLGSTSQGDLNGIAEYFNTPLSVAITGGSRSGTANSVLDGGAMSLLKTVPAAANVSPKTSQDKSSAPDKRVKQLAEDAKRLTELKTKIETLINLNPKLSPFKNQIKLDMTSEGLRIQIIDAQNRPMFDSGSSTLEPYTKDILDQLGVVLNDVENHVSIAGHTDSLAYTGGANGYSNWELSSERANAARRELINGGMIAQKVLQVRGLSDALPLDPTDPAAPGNRRISIVVLNKQTEEAFFRDGGRTDIANVSQVASAVAASTARPIAASSSK